MKNQKGFTLIELMIVVAIIAILAAIAISQYQDYVIRSQVSEGSSLGDGLKTAVAEFYNNRGRFAQGSNGSYGIPAAVSIQGSYVISVGVGTGNGKITAHFQATAPKKANTKIDGLVLVFSPVTHAGSIEWNCTQNAGSTVAEKYLPSICRP